MIGKVLLVLVVVLFVQISDTASLNSIRTVETAAASENAPQVCEITLPTCKSSNYHISKFISQLNKTAKFQDS